MATHLHAHWLGDMRVRTCAFALSHVMCCAIIEYIIVNTNVTAVGCALVKRADDVRAYLRACVVRANRWIT